MLEQLREQVRAATASRTPLLIRAGGSKDFVEQSGRYLIGAIRLQAPAAMKPVIEELKNRSRARP